MPKNCPMITAASGLGLLVFGIFGSSFLFPKIIRSQIHKNIDLVDGSMGYDTWRKQPFPLKFKIRLFNVSNPEEVQNGAKPIVREIGPFVYDEYRERVNIKLNKSRDTLTYHLKKTYIFNAKESGCHSPEDTVTIINAALVGTALQVYLLVPSALPMVSTAIPYLFPDAKNIFLTTKVKDILFDGIRLLCQNSKVDLVCGALKGALPRTIRQADNGKDFIFSMFGHLNNTLDGPWEMGRGMTNTTRGQIYSYEKKEVLDFWNDEYCNTINGSDATVFPLPEEDKPYPRIYTFAEDFCRSIYIEFENKTEIFDIPVYRYSNTIGPFRRSDENECFCPYVTQDDGDEELVCPPEGIADVTPCIKAPVLISFPHFYLGDKSLRNYVSGMNPSKEEHENYVYLEPRTATPVSGRKRIQMNIEVKPLEGFQMLENVTSGIFPILWVEEGATLPPDYVDLLKSNFSKIGILSSTKWVAIAFGMITMIIGGVMYLRQERMLCFASNDTVDITQLKKASGGGGGEVNVAYESNPNLYPQITGNSNVSNNIRLRPQNNNADQRSVEAWNGNQQQ